MDLIRKGGNKKDLIIDNKTYQRNLDMHTYSSQIKKGKTSKYC